MSVPQRTDISADRCPRCGARLVELIGEDHAGRVGMDRWCGLCDYQDAGEPWTREQIRERIRFVLGDS